MDSYVLLLLLLAFQILLRFELLHLHLEYCCKKALYHVIVLHKQWRNQNQVNVFDKMLLFGVDFHRNVMVVLIHM